MSDFEENHPKRDLVKIARHSRENELQLMMADELEHLTEQLLGVDSVHLEAKIKRLQAKVEALEGVVNGDKYDDPYAMWERACKYKTAAAEQELWCPSCKVRHSPDCEVHHHLMADGRCTCNAATEHGESDGT